MGYNNLRAIQGGEILHNYAERIHENKKFATIGIKHMLVYPRGGVNPDFISSGISIHYNTPCLGVSLNRLSHAHGSKDIYLYTYKCLALDLTFSDAAFSLSVPS